MKRVRCQGDIVLTIYRIPEWNYVSSTLILAISARSCLFCTVSSNCKEIGHHIMLLSLSCMPLVESSLLQSRAMYRNHKLQRSELRHHMNESGTQKENICERQSKLHVEERAPQYW